jgi:hypothetical protein
MRPTWLTPAEHAASIGGPKALYTTMHSLGPVMSNTPTQPKPPPNLDCDLAAHERRAQLIAQLHKQAIATAGDLAVQRKASTTGPLEDRRRRKAEWLCMSAFLLALGSIVVVGCILIKVVPWR